MTRYLIDSSGLWRLLRDDTLRYGWSEVIASGVVGSCGPQRAEFRRSTPRGEPATRSRLLTLLGEYVLGLGGPVWSAGHHRDPGPGGAGEARPAGHHTERR